MEFSNNQQKDIKSIININSEDVLNKFISAINLNKININKFLDNEEELFSFLNECSFTNEQINKINKILCDINKLLADKDKNQHEIMNAIYDYYYQNNSVCDNSALKEDNDSKLYFVLFILLVIIVVCKRK